MRPGNGHQLMFEADNYERQNGCSTSGTRDIGNIVSICSFSYLCLKTNVAQTLHIMLATVKLRTCVSDYTSK
jgi:hypothetical protein